MNTPQALQAANWHMARLWDRKAQGRPAKPDLYTRECIKNAYLAACAGAMGTAEGWLMRAGVT